MLNRGAAQRFDSMRLQAHFTEHGKACCRCVAKRGRNLSGEVCVHHQGIMLTAARYRGVDIEGQAVHTEYLESIEMFAGPLVSEEELLIRMTRAFGTNFTIK